MRSGLADAQEWPKHIAAWMFGLLTAYFVAQVVLRSVYTTSLTVDEAEMIVLTQAFTPGYGGSQPPLYPWLQIGAFQLLGVGIPALAIVKYLLLWTTFVFMFLSARLVLGDDIKAALTTIALFVIPQISWKSQFDLTHTVLAVMIAAMSLYFFLRLLKEGKWLDYIAFGATFGLGTLSKYSYTGFAVALLAAAATIPPFRQRLMSVRMLAALGLGLIVLLPHLEWLWSHPAALTTRAFKFQIAAGDVGPVTAWGRGLLGIFKGLVSSAALTIAVFALIAFLPWSNSRLSRSDHVAAAGWLEGKQLILRTFGISLGLVLILVLTTRTTELRDHWLQPLVLVLPLGLFILLESRFTAAKMKVLALVSGGLALAAMVGLAVTHLFPDLSGQPTRATAPYGALAMAIRNLGFAQGYILADNTHTAGNLKLRFSQSMAAEPQYGMGRRQETEPPKSLLIAWSGTDPTMPEQLKALWRELCGGEAEVNRPATPVTAFYEHSKRIPFTLQVIVTPMCKSSKREIESSSAMPDNLATLLDSNR